MTPAELVKEFPMTERLIEHMLKINPAFKSDEEQRALLRAHVLVGISTEDDYRRYLERELGIY